MTITVVIAAIIIIVIVKDCIYYRPGSHGAGSCHPGSLGTNSPRFGLHGDGCVSLRLDGLATEQRSGPEYRSTPPTWILEKYTLLVSNLPPEPYLGPWQLAWFCCTTQERSSTESAGVAGTCILVAALGVFYVLPRSHPSSFKARQQNFSHVARDIAVAYPLGEAFSEMRY